MLHFSHMINLMMHCNSFKANYKSARMQGMPYDMSRFDHTNNLVHIMTLSQLPLHRLYQVAS